jgi:hypothetical protein
MQVPLDPAAHLIAGRHDAAAGGGQVGGEPLDLPLTFGKVGRVALGLLAERLFPRGLLAGQPAHPGGQRRDRHAEHDRGLDGLDAPAELVVRLRVEIVERQRRAHAGHDSRRPFRPGQHSRRDDQQHHRDQHAIHMVTQRQQRDRQRDGHDQGGSRPGSLPGPCAHAGIVAVVSVSCNAPESAED